MLNFIGSDWGLLLLSVLMTIMGWIGIIYFRDEKAYCSCGKKIESKWQYCPVCGKEIEKNMK